MKSSCASSGSDGQTLIGYCDPDRLADHIKELSPADADLADDLAEGVRDFLTSICRLCRLSLAR